MRTPDPEVVAMWPSPNFDNPNLKGEALIVTQAILVPFALLVLAARLYVRVIVLKRAGWDDALMVFAWMFSLGVSITVILATRKYGWDMHVWDLTLPMLVQGRKASIAAQTLFLFATSSVKLSILVSYLRIAIRGTCFWVLTWAGIVWVALTFVAFFVILWVQCIPACHYWDDIDSHSCTEEGPPLIAQTTTGVLSDLLIYLLPLPTLLTLRLSTSQRLALLLIFSLGLVVVFAGCMRLYWVIRVTLYTYDVTWDGFDLWIWTAVEVNLGVVCGCAPLLKPLVARVLVRLTGGKGGAGHGCSSLMESLKRFILNNIGEDLSMFQNNNLSL